MEFNQEKLKEWWDKIAPEDQDRIINKNNAFNFLFKDNAYNIIKYEPISKTDESVKPPPITLIKSDRYK